MEATIMTKTINEVMNDLKSSLITEEDAKFVFDMYDNGNGMSYNDSLAKCLGDIRILLDEYLDMYIENEDY